ncbi:MAG: site-2 protease family protein [Myxococcota bacterium]
MREFITPIVLYLLTVLSTLYAGARLVAAAGTREGADLLQPEVLLTGWTYAVPLMVILTFHELGHYVMAKRHGVKASPPYFIPLPFVLFGTMGAVIRMPDAIRSRNALLDVGAAGPLAGMVVAIPLLAYGLATSPVQAVPEDAMLLIEGRSVLYLAMLWVLKGPIPEGHDIMLNPVAFAGWTGLFVTMINLLPVWQLDGGHVAYALLGERQNRLSRWLHRLLPAVGVTVALGYGGAALVSGADQQAIVSGALAGMPWVVWALVLLLLMRLGGGASHPPTAPDALTPARRKTAILTLALFVLLFMPAPLRIG